MAEAFLAGIAAGFGIALPVGAIAVLIVDTGIRHGFRTAASAGAGTAAADTVYAAIAVAFGTTLGPALVPVMAPLRAASVVLLAVIAVRGLLAARRELRDDPARRPLPPGRLRVFTTFLGLTLLNPMTIVFFAALVVGLGTVGSGPMEKVAWVAGVGLASLSWQQALALGGARLRHRMSPRVRTATSVVGSLVVIGFAGVIAARLVAV